MLVERAVHSKHVMRILCPHYLGWDGMRWSRGFRAGFWGSRSQEIWLDDSSTTYQIQIGKANIYCCYTAMLSISHTQASGPDS